MARKGWHQLSDAYRNRLQRGGITQSAYERGESLQKARGHGETPERPSQAYTKSGRVRFRKYLERVGEIRKRTIDRKVRLFSQRFGWNEERARDYVMQGGTDVPKPTKKKLLEAEAMSDDEIEEMLHDPNIDEQWRFLWYH